MVREVKPIRQGKHDGGLPFIRGFRVIVVSGRGYNKDMIIGIRYKISIKELRQILKEKECILISKIWDLLNNLDLFKIFVVKR